MRLRCVRREIVEDESWLVRGEFVWILVYVSRRQEALQWHAIDHDLIS